MLPRRSWRGSAGRCALVEQPRALVKEVTPAASERAHPSWGVIRYRAGSSMRDVVAALLPQRGYVNLEFGDGVDLPDPAHRLQGMGRRLRHVKIRAADDVRDPDVRARLEAAARHRGLSCAPGRECPS